MNKSSAVRPDVRLQRESSSQPRDGAGRYSTPVRVCPNNLTAAIARLPANAPADSSRWLNDQHHAQIEDAAAWLCLRAFCTAH